MNHNPLWLFSAW